jgi:hypothetical protein
MKNFRILTITAMLCASQLASTGAVACANTSREHVENKTDLPAYHNSIADISLDYNGAMLTGSIKLDNGALLHIIDYKSRDDSQITTWRPGDLLTFQAEADSERGLLLSAKRIGGHGETVEPYFIFDVMETQNCLSIAEINEEGKYIKLNDNSVWDFSWFNRFATKHWKVGEFVLVQHCGEKNHYHFINLSAPVSLKASSANALFTIK